jgi:hypothetical protein
MDWAAIQQLHADAAERLALRAEKVDPQRWLVPRALGKWTPAQVVEHLSRVYDVVRNEMEGGTGMKLRLSFPKRLFLRIIYMPRILKGRGFPEGAPAPYELRPATIASDQRTAIAEFRSRAQEFAASAAKAHDSGLRVRITHAYFGTASVKNGLLLCARHIEHHEKQLPRA